MKTTKTTTRPAAKHSGKLQRIDWEFRRLRNQVVKFYAGKDQELARTLRVDLEAAREYTDVREIAIKRWGVGIDQWHQSLNWFFSHRVNKRTVA